MNRSRPNVIFHIEDFAKIKSAHINVTGYTVFVGVNNSGKTMLMQLIYSVLNALATERNYLESLIFTHNESEMIISQELYTKIEETINTWLKTNIESIIKRTFQQEISIGSITCELNNITENYKIEFEHTEERNKIYCHTLTGKPSFSLSIKPDLTADDSFRIGLWFFVHSKLLDLGSIRNSSTIYLPAARAGLLLLAPAYFDKLAQDNITENDYMPSFSLTSPTVDYLRFLVTFKEHALNKKNNAKLLKYIENNLVNGSFSFRSAADISYTEHGTSVQTPLHLTSSMLTEVMPFVQLFSGEQNYTHIMCDEVENSIHPSLQRKLACFFNRVVNSGRNLLISTHSDTMAFAINNILMLSRVSAEKQKNLLKKFCYEKEDILENPQINVYQFTMTSEGTVVDSLEDFHVAPYGFQFTQFDDSTRELYNEATAILEAIDE